MNKLSRRFKEEIENMGVVRLLDLHGELKENYPFLSLIVLERLKEMDNEAEDTFIAYRNSMVCPPQQESQNQDYVQAPPLEKNP